MDLATIEMPRAEARKAFLEYRHAVRRHHEETARSATRHLVEADEALMRGYRSLARGQQVLSLRETLSLGGTETKALNVSRWDGVSQSRMTIHVHVPKIAVMRADRPHCWTAGVQGDGRVRFIDDPNMAHRRGNYPGRVAASAGTFPDPPDRDGMIGWRADVPVVPPALRPSSHLRNYHVLWEAEWSWQRPPTPPRDPALLKHLGGDLYAVLAVWDLTELERAVLALR